MSDSIRLKSIIQNPRGFDFKNTYVVLGKFEGKKRLREDCLRLRVQIPLAGMQAIETGFSHKARMSYQNDIYGADSSVCIRWGDVDINDNNAKKHEETEKRKAKEAEEKKIRDAKELVLQKKKEKEMRIQKRKEKKWEQEKAKMAVVDSWEDL
jgi:hypothetical protein